MEKNISLTEKIIFILKPESSFFIVSIIYGLVASLLTLAIPISVQSLVNTVSFGVLIQPIIVLSLLLFTLLIVSGSLNALQIYIIELFQRRFYARMIAEISGKLLRSKVSHLQEKNGVELVNRYFDLMTIQKSTTTLVSGGMAIILQTLAGLVLLALYHPYFLIFDIILILLIFIVFAVFTKKAVYSANMESKAKYKTAAWLEEIARENNYFKTQNRRNDALVRSNQYIENYLLERTRHFKQVFSQKILLLIIYALMSAFILGLGGILVIKGQLSIGQLVAAELVMTIILASFSKASKYLEAFYDLHAATEKVSQFYKLEEEISDSNLENLVLPIKSFHFKGAQVASDSDFHLFDKSFHSNSFYYIHAEFSSVRQSFLETIQLRKQLTKGSFHIGEQPANTLKKVQVRDHIVVIDRPSVFNATLKENLTFGLSNIPLSEIRQALEIVDLGYLETSLKDGLETCLQSIGQPLWECQLIRLEIARAIISKPQFVVMGEEFGRIGDYRRYKILRYLKKHKVGLILFSSNLYPMFKFDEYYILTKEGFIAEKNDESIYKKINEKINEE